jgi:hypothetical protein
MNVRDAFTALEYWEAYAEKDPEGFAGADGPDQWFCRLRKLCAAIDTLAAGVAEARSLAETRLAAARVPVPDGPAAGHISREGENI